MVLLVLLEAGWMVFDGTRALVVGDYVTPATGPYAGQLGPWAGVVSAVGLEPRSTAVKLLFVAYGAVGLAVLAGWLRRTWDERPMLIAAAGTLWYLPIGTALSALQLALLVVVRARRGLR